MIILYLKLTSKMMNLKISVFMTQLYAKEIFIDLSLVFRITSSVDGFKFPTMRLDISETSINQWDLANR